MSIESAAWCVAASRPRVDRRVGYGNLHVEGLADRVRALTVVEPGLPVAPSSSRSAPTSRHAPQDSVVRTKDQTPFCPPVNGRL